MSQAGKVLHLYVEVRSVTEEEERMLDRGDHGLHRPDLLALSQRSSALSSPNRSPDPPHVDCGLLSAPSSKTSSRHSVSFHLQNPDTTGSPTQYRRQDALCDDLARLLQVISPQSSGPGSVRRSSDTDHYQGRFSGPATPTSARRSCDVTGAGRRNEEGKTSVVSFGYVEKASVHSAVSRGPCVYQTDRLTVHSSKSPSEPKWTLGDRRPSPRGSPHLKRTSLDAVASAATCRAVEEFESPRLRPQFSGHGPETFSPALPRRHQPPRCRSLGGSPVLTRHSLTLPSKIQLSDPDGGTCRHPSNGIPRSPASDRLCAHAGFSSRWITPTRTLSSQSPWSGDDGSGSSTKFHPPLPAGRPTDIQHDVPSAVSQLSPGGNSESRHEPLRCASRTSDAASPSSGSVSSSFNSEVAYKLAVEATRRSTVSADRRTPSPTHSPAESMRSESPNTGGSVQRRSPEPEAEQNLQWRAGPVSPLPSPAKLHRAAASRSPVLDPRQQSPSKVTSVLHRYQTPQFTGDRRAAADQRGQRDENLSESSSWDNLELPKRVLWNRNWTTSRQQDVSEGGHVLYCPRKEDGRPRDGEDEGVLMREELREELKEELQELSRAAVTSSLSSSGVTGSIGDTLSQSSHDTAIQTDSSSAPTPSSRSQKIARAKWEFLFGRKSEDEPCTKDSSPTSGSPPSPTPPPYSSPSPSSSSSSSSSHWKPANQRRGRGGEGRTPSHHNVQQVEVELVNPRTGVVRRTLKYSETDLDAVPLRCYRETDLDEVMRAEAEELELDSVGNFSPTHVSTNPGTGEEEEEEQEEEEEEQEEEGGVVSWASVRMLGDKRRQRAAKEEDEVFSLLLQRSSDASCDANAGLKSPVSIGSPRLPSDSNMDSFSRHFENIMESHRAKGTSYSSLDSVDLLTSGSTSVFTFDLPTLTPEIQSQICDGAKQITELSFAPLARPDPAASSETSRSETALSASVGGLRGGAKEPSGPPVRTRSEKDSWRRSNNKDGFRKTNSAPSLHSSSRERQVNLPPELLYPQDDVAERLARGGSDDALTNGTKADLPAAKRLAKRLFHLDGFRKSDVARHLSKNNEFSQKVAQEYLRNFNFSGLTIDQALRSFLTQFALMGETQERERVLSHFSKRFRECNSTDNTEDSVHTLTCAVMLLNSDLHGNNVGKRMSCNQFISNLEGLNDGRDFPKDLLKTLYSSIKNEKLQWTIDEEDLRKSMSELTDVRTDSASHTMKRLGSGGNPLVGVAQQSDGELYKNGFLVRKVHADPDGKRTPRGKRGWKSFYAMLKGLVLYLQKDEYRTERELTEEDVKNAVSIHHSLAMRAVDYRKRPNVFYLRTADWRVFLFQAPNPEQMQSWITRINVVAAMFSAPPFPAAIGSQKRFSRPLLPGSNTKLSQEEQVKCHENRFRAVSSELADLLTASPDRKVKGRELEEHNLRQEYLEFEKTRYGTYAMLLRAKLASGDEDLVTFESRLFDDGGLQRAHSSPTLPQDAAAAGKEKNRGHKTSKSLKVASSSSSSTMKSGDDSGEDAKKKNDAQPELHTHSEQEGAP